MLTVDSWTDRNIKNAGESDFQLAFNTEKEVDAAKNAVAEIADEVRK